MSATEIGPKVLTTNPEAKRVVGYAILEDMQRFRADPDPVFDMAML